MKQPSILSLFLICFTFIVGNRSWAEDFGIVMDISGTVELISSEEKSHIDLGTNLLVGDKLSLKENSELVIVSYEDCIEWSIEGPSNIKVSTSGFEGDEEKIVNLKQMPVCYNFSNMNDTESPFMGGITLRGRKSADPLKALREEYEDGNADNSTLITLIMYGIKKNKTEETLPYFNELKKRRPDSSLVKEIAKHFEK